VRAREALITADPPGGPLPGAGDQILPCASNIPRDQKIGPTCKRGKTRGKLAASILFPKDDFEGTCRADQSRQAEFLPRQRWQDGGKSGAASGGLRGVKRCGHVDDPSKPSSRGRGMARPDVENGKQGRIGSDWAFPFPRQETRCGILGRNISYRKVSATLRPWNRCERLSG